MWEIIQKVIPLLGGATVLLFAIGWVFRAIINHVLSRKLEKHKAALQATVAKDLERYKAELKAASDRELERLRADMQLQSLEHEVRFRKLHDQVSEVTSGVHTRLFRLYTCVAFFISPAGWPGRTKDDKFKEVTKADAEFWDFFQSQQLFIRRDLAEEIRSLAQVLAEIAVGFKLGLWRDKDGVESPNGQPDHWLKAIQEFREKAEPGFERLQALFQDSLGFQSPATTNHQLAPK